MKKKKKKNHLKVKQVIIIWLDVLNCHEIVFCLWNALWDSPMHLYIFTYTAVSNCCYAGYCVQFSNMLIWMLPHIFLKEDVWQVSLLIDNSLCLNKSAIFKKSYVFWLTCHHSWVKKEDFEGMMAVCRSLCVMCLLFSTSWRCIGWGCFHININEMPKIFNAWTSTVHVWSASLLFCVFFLKILLLSVQLFPYVSLNMTHFDSVP